MISKVRISIVLILSVVFTTSIIMFLSERNTRSSLYKIIAQDKQYYYTNSYSEKDGCITFTQENHNIPLTQNNVYTITLCGNFTIIQQASAK